MCMVCLSLVTQECVSIVLGESQIHIRLLDRKDVKTTNVRRYQTIISSCICVQSKLSYRLVYLLYLCIKILSWWCFFPSKHLDEWIFKVYHSKLVSSFKLIIQIHIDSHKFISNNLCIKVFLNQIPLNAISSDKNPIPHTKYKLMYDFKAISPS